MLLSSHGVYRPSTDLYEFGVKLDGGNIIGAIKIVARVGGISTENFDSTKFVIEDSNNNFYEADLGGLTGGEINFVPKTCGSVASVVEHVVKIK